MSKQEAHDSEPTIPSLRTKVIKRKKKHNSWAGISVEGEELNQADREVKGQWTCFCCGTGRPRTSYLLLTMGFEQVLSSGL